MLSRREALIGMTSLAGISLFSGCAKNPVTGDYEFMIMSKEEEIALGRQSHDQIIAEYGSYSDERLQSWLSELGREMAAGTHRPDLPYSFTVLDSPVVNAFAVPGGFVYINRGIMAHFDDEAQFAGVLAHEIGHITARHSAARYSKAKLANAGLMLGSIFSEEFSRFSQFASLGASLLFLKFSRDDERQADRLGVEYSSKLGFDATHMSTFFKTLKRMSPTEGSLPEWTSTHPDPGDRVEATRRMALEYQKEHPDRQYVVNRDAYLGRIEGMVYGDDPRQGYVEEGVFYHPDLTFRFPVPGGWKVVNQPTQVQMVPQEQQNALVMFSLAKQDEPRAASVSFVSENGISVERSGPLTINGMEAFTTLGAAQSNAGAIAVVSYYIKMDETVYMFHGLTDPAALETYQPLFEQVATGFDRLTDSDKIEVEPQRIRVVSLGSDMTFSRALENYEQDAERSEELAILNNANLDDSLPAGTKIKILST